MKKTVFNLIVAGLLLAAGGYLYNVAHAVDASAKKSKAALTVDDKPIMRDARMGTSYSSTVKKAAPSVVYIYTTKTVRQSPAEMMPFFNDDMFRRFFGDRFGRQGQMPRQQKQHGLGSGVIVTEDGYILTNNHVVDGADEVRVTLAKDKKEHIAKVVGRDPKTDIAVLKIEEKNLSHVTLGDSDKIEVGDVVIAIGNPFGIGQTVTMGIISAVGRGNIGIEDYEDFIQTDAAINPGNSGGAMVDVEGRLIGINTAILSRTGGNIGVGFAVPVNLARSVMDRLVQHGKIVRGFLGVSIQDITPELAKEFRVPESGGALVGGVTANSAAGAVGIKSGDIITALDGKPVKDSRTLRLQVSGMSPGKKVAVTALRDGKPMNFTVTLKEMPDSEEETAAAETNSSDSETLQGVAVGELDAKTRKQLDIPADVKGALVLEVEPGSAAAEAGLRQGNVILEINRQPITSASDAVKATKNAQNKRTLVRVWNDGGSRYVVVDETKKK